MTVENDAFELQPNAYTQTHFARSFIATVREMRVMVGKQQSVAAAVCRGRCRVQGGGRGGLKGLLPALSKKGESGPMSQPAGKAASSSSWTTRLLLQCSSCIALYQRGDLRCDHARSELAWGGPIAFLQRLPLRRRCGIKSGTFRRLHVAAWYMQAHMPS